MLRLGKTARQRPWKVRTPGVSRDLAPCWSRHTSRLLHFDVEAGAQDKLPDSYVQVLRETVAADKVVIRHDPIFGFAAFATEKIARGEVVMRVGQGAVSPLSSSTMKERCAAQAPAFYEHVKKASLEFAKSPFGVVTGQEESQRSENFESLCHVRTTVLSLIPPDSSLNGT